MFVFIYIFVYDVRFHDVMLTTIIKQLTKDNEEIEKIEKYNVRIVNISLFRLPQTHEVRE